MYMRLAGAIAGCVCKVIGLVASDAIAVGSVSQTFSNVSASACQLCKTSIERNFEHVCLHHSPSHLTRHHPSCSF